MRKLPKSLLRSGRFDRKIEIERPNDRDAAAIISHYLSSKKVADSVNREDLAKMISYNSCAELETILNDAAIRAAFRRKDAIEMEDLVQAVLRMQYDSSDDLSNASSADKRRTAFHEAGHLVVSEVLVPCSVGLATLHATGDGNVDGFIHRCKELPRRPYHAMVCLAGKAAVELYYAEACASGCQSDIYRAYDFIRDGLSASGTHGMGMIEVSSCTFTDPSESLNARNEAVTQAEMERLLFKTRDVLLKNRAFLEATVDALVEKGTLLYSDIRAIREAHPVTPVAV